MEKLIEPIEAVCFRDGTPQEVDRLRSFLRDQGWTAQSWEDPPGAYHPPHDHPYSHRVYVEDGTIEFTVEGSKYRLTEGDSLDLPRTIEHSATVPEGGSVRYWLLRPE